MNNEYIIVNKTALLERIAQLERQIKESAPEETGEHDWHCEDKIEELNMVLYQSTPLIPEIENAIQFGALMDKRMCYINKQVKEYIANLKLDV